jgi:hypothetical protein
MVAPSARASGGGGAAADAKVVILANIRTCVCGKRIV